MRNHQEAKAGALIAKPEEVLQRFDSAEKIPVLPKTALFKCLKIKGGLFSKIAKTWDFSARD